MTDPALARSTRLGLGLAAAAVLAGAAPAVAAPPAPLAPLDGATLDTRRPAFSWSPATPTGSSIASYEVRLQPGGTLLAVAPGDSAGAVAATDVPDDATVTWVVVAIDADGGEQVSEERAATVATLPGQPAISEGPAGPISTSSPTFAWTGSRAASSWAVTDASGAAIGSGSEASGSGRVTVAGLPDGAHRFQVAQRNVVGVEGAAAVRDFVVDTVAPPDLTLTPGQAATGRATTRTFGWSGVELGARVEWRLVGSGGAIARGPSSAVGGQTALEALAPGSYVFQIRQFDAAGNASAWAGAPFAVFPAPPPTPSVAGGSVILPSSNWKRLTPRRGARITSRRPVLRWKRGAKRTTLYNVQVFRVRNRTRLRKVYSAFPRGTRLRLPARRRLARGSCYVWRVWPFIGSRSTSRPLGVSHFCVRR